MTAVPLLAVIGLVLLVLALAHIIPVVLGVVVGLVLIVLSPGVRRRWWP